MAKHMETMEEACANLWKLLDGVNKGFKANGEDAKQYHDIVASLYKLKGLEMAAEYEESEKGGGSSRRGGSYDNGGHSGLYWEPWMGNSYGNGNSYGRGSYEGHGGGSYGGGYSYGNGSYDGHGGSYGNSYGGGSYDNGDGYSGRSQPRNEAGQFKEDGRPNRSSASYHSQQDMIRDLREQMQDADPETARCYRKVIRDMQSNM